MTARSPGDPGEARAVDPGGAAAAGGAAAVASRSELGLRVASSLVLGIVALGTTWAGGWLFAAFWLAAGIAVGFEWIAMAKVARPARLVGVVGAALAGLVLAVRLRADPLVVAAIAAAGAGALLVLAASLRDRAWAVAGLGCGAVVTLVPILLRDGFGALAVLWIFAVVWTTDIAAYFVGRAIGGPKLWPRVSPKKTWSGFGGGLLAGTLAGAAVPYLGSPLAAEVAGGRPGIGLWILGCALASVASQGGDLAESAMKRAFGAKDSGRLIPGHGGVMDRLDGFAAVALLAGIAMAGARLAHLSASPP